MSVSGETDTQRETLYSNLYRLNLYPNSQFENTGTSADPAYKYASPVADPDRAGLRHPDRRAGQVRQGLRQQRLLGHLPHRVAGLLAALPEGRGRTGRRLRAAVPRRWLGRALVLARLRRPDDRHQQRRRVRRRVPARRAAQGPARHLRRRAEERHRAADAQAASGRKGLETSIFKKYTDTEHRRVGVLGSSRATSTTPASSQMAAALAKDPRTPGVARPGTEGRGGLLRRPVRPVRQPVRPEHRVLPGPQRRRQLEPEQGRLRPRVAGAASTPRPTAGTSPSTPRRTGRAWPTSTAAARRWRRSSTQFFADPEQADKPGGYGGTIHEMVEARAVRMGQLGMSNQPSHHIPYMYDYVQHAVQDAGAGPRDHAAALRRRPRSARVTPATRTTARCRRGTSCPRWASTRCSPVRRTGPIGSPLFDKVVVHRDGGDLTITADNNSRQQRLRAVA